MLVLTRAIHRPANIALHDDSRLAAGANLWFRNGASNSIFDSIVGVEEHWMIE
jgi:hypothetical protein